MNLSEQNRKNLAAMQLVQSISERFGTASWLWGGLVADVYHGQMLREHDDLDYLTWNLHTLKPKLVEAFAEAGWQAESLENDDLRLKKDGVKIHLGHVQFIFHAKWTHNGKKGALLFPSEWLRIEPVPFYNLKLHVVEPEFQYVLKEHPELLNPEWTRRRKDLQDKQLLREMLLKKYPDLQHLPTLVLSE
jgi:hypothetical protein